MSLLESFATHQTRVKKPSRPNLNRQANQPIWKMAPGDRQLEVSWQAPDGDGVGITGYEVEYRKDGEQSWTTSSASIDEETDTDVTIYKTIISSLDVSTLYDVRVSAVNAAYNWAEGSGTTLPDVPANLEVTPGIRQLALSWGEPAETGTVAINWLCCGVQEDLGDELDIAHDSHRRPENHALRRDHLQSGQQRRVRYSGQG